MSMASILRLLVLLPKNVEIIIGLCLINGLMPFNAFFLHVLVLWLILSTMGIRNSER